MSNSTRPSSSNTYDERFVVPLEASRRGAHRARVSPVMTVLPVAAVVGIVVGAIALVYIVLGGTSPDGGTAATSNPTASATSSVAAAPAATSDGVSAGGATGSVDKSIVVDVFNGTAPSVSGLAKRAATKLSTAGWTTGRVETWTGAAVAQTTVYYATESQRATAEAIVAALDRGVAKLSPSRAGTGVTVVISNDYPGGNAVRSTPTGRPPAGADRSGAKAAAGSATSKSSDDESDSSESSSDSERGDGKKSKGGDSSSSKSSRSNNDN